MATARIDEKNWYRCSNCSHKLGRMVGAQKGKAFPAIEVKCHSCGTLNYIMVGGMKDYGDDQGDA